MKNKNYILSDIYRVPKDKQLKRSEILYHGSLTPLWFNLYKWKNYSIKVSYADSVFTADYKVLPYENEINPHLYKPLFYEKKNEQTLYIQVTSVDTLWHTLRSLAIINAHLSLSNDIPITVSFYNKDYHHFASHWQLHERVMIGRCISIINYFRLIYLLENKYLDRTELDKISINLELSRIKPIEINQYDSLFELADKAIKLEKLQSKSKVVIGYNLSWQNQKLTVLQLPWGVGMAEELIKALYQLQPQLKKIGLVGGVGYIGQNKASIDDLFVPDSLIKTDKEGNYSETKIANFYSSIPKNKYFPEEKKNLSTGKIFSVIPLKGALSRSEMVKKSPIECQAIDMELKGFIKAFEAIDSKTDLAAVYYIMDTIHKLQGDTYYSYRFLEKLFSSTERGKYVCIEKISNFLTSD
ncbi:MAG: hypothetical protein PVJ09_02235 [Candidatus Woesebacteria bacterium]|jgi:hypothetical protein